LGWLGAWLAFLASHDSLVYWRG